MDIREFSYILTIVDCGSISKAAILLYISQPSLSMYIKNLERRLGFPFFEKADGKHVLTSEGALYVDYARQITRLNDDLYQRLDGIHRLETGLVRIGITRTKGATLLPRLLPAFRRKHPGVRTEFFEGTSQKLEDMVDRRELDFILVNYPFREKDLSFLDLFDEEIAIAVPTKNPVCRQSTFVEGIPFRWMDAKLLKEEEFILLRPGQKMRQVADEIFLKAGFAPHILLETSSATTAYKLTCAGEGISFVIPTYIDEMNYSDNVVFFSIGDPQLLNKFVVAYPEKAYISSAAQAMIECIQELLSPHLQTK